MIMGMYLLADLGGELDDLDHRNFEQARQLIDTKGEAYFARAIVSVGRALETLYGGQPVGAVVNHLPGRNGGRILAA